MTIVATHNFRAVDQLLAQPAPQAAGQINALGRDAARAFLRYHSAELNRWYFETWEAVQIALGLAVFSLLLFTTHEGKVGLSMALLMLFIVLLERFLLTPQIVALGRAIDFVPAGQFSPERSRFWMLHGAYSGLEVLKMGLAAALVVKMLWRRRRSSGNAAEEIDLVDKADHGHVNR
jgi:hypothetical protein